MNNSVETILHDIKKLFKELELAYGEVKPHLCNVESAFDQCPNTKCWVQKIRDEQHDRLSEFERIIFKTINELTEIQRGAIRKEDIQRVIEILDHAINPTPCERCSSFNSCTNIAYKNATIHYEPCCCFKDKEKNKEEPSKLAIQF